MKRKIVGILVIMLFIISAFSSISYGTSKIGKKDSSDELFSELYVDDDYKCDKDNAKTGSISPSPDDGVFSMATDTEIEASIDKGIAWLASKQNTGGSWGLSGNTLTADTSFVLIKLQDYAYEKGYNSPFDPLYTYSANVVNGWKFLFTKLTSSNDGVYVKSVPITKQLHGVILDDPDTLVNGRGICLTDDSGVGQVYHTGIFLMALVASGKIAHPNEGHIFFPGGTAFPQGINCFGEIAQDVVDWLAFAQGDTTVGTDWGTFDGRGGYAYKAANNNFGDGGHTADNSNSGYAYLGLSVAEATVSAHPPSAEAFKCIVPGWVKVQCENWVNYIQYLDALSPKTGDDGGSFYNHAQYDGYYYPYHFSESINLLKTGNLLFEMVFCDIDDYRFERAINYIERHWHDDIVVTTTGQTTQPGWGKGWGYDTDHDDLTPCADADSAKYQAMWCLMKGLQYGRITTINLATVMVPPTGIATQDWYNTDPFYSNSAPPQPYDDFANVLLAQQNVDNPGGPDYGSWPQCQRSDTQSIRATVWALLTLEKIPTLYQPILTKSYIIPDEHRCVNPCEYFTYVVCYDNIGNPDPITNIFMTDTLPPEVVLISISNIFGGPPLPGVNYDIVTNTVTWGPVTVGADVIECFYLKVLVKPDTPKGIKIFNTVTATSDEWPPATASVYTPICGSLCFTLSFEIFAPSPYVKVKAYNPCHIDGIENLNWNIKLDGGLILQGGETSGIIPFLPKNESVIIQSENIFGIGLVEITVVATADCCEAIISGKGLVLGPIIIVFPSEIPED